MADDDRKLVAVLAVDCVGYSAAAERDQAAAARRVALLRTRLDALAQEHGGRVFSTAGDGFMLEFPLASAAVRAAIALLDEAVKPESELPRVRAGAHLGEVLISGDDLLGHGVNVAARLSALAEPNGLVVSGPLKTQLHGEVEVRLDPLGEMRLSKMRQAMEAYAYVPADTKMRRWVRRARAFVRGHRRASAAAAAASVLTALTTGAWLMTRTVSYVVDGIDPIIQTELDEVQPSLTPDGRYVVYAVDVGASRWNNVELFMRPLASDESTQLTNTPDLLEYSPAVSPSGDRLAYIRSLGVHLRRAEDRCQIMLRTFPDGVDRHVGTCEGVAGTLRLSWTADGRGLVYSDLPRGQNAGEGPARIRMLDVETGQTRAFVPPMEHGHGDHNATVSPDGRRVALNRVPDMAASALQVFDLQSGRFTRVTNDVSWVQSDWLNNRQLFVLIGRDRGNELWLYNANGSGGRRLLPALSALRSMDYSAGVLAVEMPGGSHNLVRYSRNGASRIEAGSQDDCCSDFSKDGVLAFVRVQSGEWLYLQRPGEEPRRFVRLSRTYAGGLRWSPDGRRIAYVAMSDGETRLFVVDATSGVITLVRTPPQDQPTLPAWSMDGAALLYLDAPQAGRVTRVGLTGGAVERISEAGWAGVMDTAQGVIASRFEGSGLWRLRDGADPLLIHAAYSRHLPILERDWTIVDNTVYTIEAGPDGRRRVIAAAIGSRNKRTIAVIDGDPADGFAVDPSTGDVVLAIAANRQSDIGLVRLRRR